MTRQERNQEIRRLEALRDKIGRRRYRVETKCFKEGRLRPTAAEDIEYNRLDAEYEQLDAEISRLIRIGVMEK